MLVVDSFAVLTRPRKVAAYLRLGLVATLLLLMTAAAEFPVFRMPEFDKARDDKEFFVEIPDVDIPEVSERNYTSGKLPRLPVYEVVVAGVIPHPALGITVAEVQQVVDESFRQAQDIELDDNGFTQRDLDDIGELLREIIEQGGYDQDDLTNLVNTVRRQEVTRGWITIEQLDQIALAVTEYYRARGFILATAFVPEQEVADGVIQLNVLEGRLGKVTVSNNEHYSADTIKAPLLPEIGLPVTEEKIESALRRINDLPGVRVRGSFGPGEKIGETTLNLGVLEEKAWSTNVLVDNHGSDSTGETRLFVTSEWLDVGNRGHRLLLGALQSEGPDNSLYGLMEYELPVTNNNQGKVKFGLSTNTFSVGASANTPKIEGKTDNLNISGSYQVARGRTFNLMLSSGLTHKDIEFNVGQNTFLSTDQEILVLTSSVDLTQLWDSQQLLLTGRAGLDLGFMLDGEATQQGTEFTKTLLNLNLLKRLAVTNILTDQESAYNFVFKTNVQYSEKFLSSAEQFSLGGPTGVRAFGPSDISVDSGVVASMEIFFDLPFDPIANFNLPLEPVKPYLFLDYGYGVARFAGGGNDQDGQIKGWGMGLRLSWPGKGAANLVFAKPHSTQFDKNFPGTEGGSRIYFDLMYQVH